MKFESQRSIFVAALVTVNFITTESRPEWEGSFSCFVPSLVDDPDEFFNHLKSSGDLTSWKLDGNLVEVWITDQFYEEVRHVANS